MLTFGGYFKLLKKISGKRGKLAQETESDSIELGKIELERYQITEGSK